MRIATWAEAASVVLDNTLHSVLEPDADCDRFYIDDLFEIYADIAFGSWAGCGLQRLWHGCRAEVEHIASGSRAGCGLQRFYESV